MSTGSSSAPGGRPRRKRRRRPPACQIAWPGHGLAYARPYPCGWRCDRHAPWALAGRPEPQPGPGWPALPSGTTHRTEQERTDP